MSSAIIFFSFMLVTSLTSVLGISINGMAINRIFYEMPIGVVNSSIALYQKDGEFNPYFAQKDLRELLKKDDVKLEAWAPLGQGNKELLNEPIIFKIAEKYHKNAGQVILRWITQEGVITFPRSVKPERIKSNFDIFDFRLTEEEMNEIRKLDKGHGTHNPEAAGVGEYLIKAFDVHADEK